MTTVSVVVPTLDRRALLSETIASVLEQRFTDWELIVVDEASTDDTQDYLRTLHDPRIRSVRRAVAGGRSVACNDGFALARGELVMFVDDDDLLRPDAIARLVAALREHPDALAATAACRLFHENGDSVRVWRPETSFTRSIWRELLFGWWSNSGQNIYRAAVVREIGGFDPSLRCVMDRRLWLDVARRGLVCVLPFVAMEYRQHAGQMTKWPNIDAERERLWAQFIESLPPSQQSHGRRIRRSAELSARAERAREAGEFSAAARLQLGAIASAPTLLASPLLRRPFWWGLKKALLRQRAP
jgi:glycosyltransferase involved in cell wall biosynthesis